MGEDVLIGGFIIQGNQLKKIILRAIGPSPYRGRRDWRPPGSQARELRDGTGALIEKQR